jgi:tripartite-type tricarboxylate transporter receptor subunit TctC
MKMPKIVLIALAISLFALSSGASWAADTWPARLVRIVVPYGPGGAADTLARIMANQLQTKYQQTFVVENRPGAGGMLGAQLAVHAAPDGYFLFVSSVGSLVGGPLLHPGMYDPIDNFTHIVFLGGEPTVVAVNPKRPIKDLESFLAYAKTQSGGLSWSSAGLGSNGSLTGQALQQITGLPLVEIGYKGGSEALLAVMANQVPGSFVALSTGAPSISAGKLRAIAMTSTKRVPGFSDVPTFAELGFPQVTGSAWYAISGPAHMPSALVQQINHDVRAAMFSPQAQAELQRHYMEGEDWDATTFSNFVKTEIAHWSAYVKPAQSK